MRTIVLTAAVVVAFSGCSGTSGGKRNGKAAPTGSTPVVSERPSIFERQTVHRQQEAERANTALTDVYGNVVR